jgi:hypothetical protein
MDDPNEDFGEAYWSWVELLQQESREQELAVLDLTYQVEEILEDPSNGRKRAAWARGKSRELWVANALSGSILSIVFGQERHEAPDVLDTESIQVIDWREGSYLKHWRYKEEKESTLKSYQGTFVLPFYMLTSVETTFKPRPGVAVVPFYQDDSAANFKARTQYWRKRRDQSAAPKGSALPRRSQPMLGPLHVMKEELLELPSVPTTRASFLGNRRLRKRIPSLLTIMEKARLNISPSAQTITSSSLTKFPA